MQRGFFSFSIVATHSLDLVQRDRPFLVTFHNQCFRPMKQALMMRRNKKFMRFAKTVLTILLLLCGPQLARAQDFVSVMDQRAEALVEQVKQISKLPNSHRVWSPEKGPWARYLEKPFTDHFSPEQAAQYREAVNSGHCSIIVALQQISFLAAHPYLARAHAEPLVAKKFHDTVIVRTNDYHACVHMLRIRRIVELAKEKEINIAPYKGPSDAEAIKAKLALLNGDKKKMAMEFNARKKICNSVRRLMTLAMTSNAKGPISALLSLTNATTITDFSKAQLYAIKSRAKSLGEPRELWDRDFSPLYYAVQPSNRAKIDRMVKAGHPGIIQLLRWQCPGDRQKQKSKPRRIAP